MANEIIHGAEKLKEKILLDARADAEKTNTETEAACDALRMEADRENALSMQAMKKQREEAVTAVLERSRTNAELYGRKLALQKRREVLDRVFDLAYDRLCALEEKARLEVCLHMLLREAEGAEEILPAKAERALLTDQLPLINVRLREKGAGALTIAQEDAPGMEHGFLLIGNGYEKDCSFRALLRDARAAEDTKVAGLLFD